MEPQRETLIHHSFRAQEAHPGARGDFSALLTQIATACKTIGAECRRAGLGAQVGASGTVGHHGDEVQRLDAFANDALTHAFDHTGLAAAMVTEEMAEVYIPAGPGSKTAEYIVCFDPIDGSSNIDVAVTVGTIFSIRRRRDPWDTPKIEDLLAPGADLLAAGYVLYGPSMVLVLATDDGVDVFIQDPATGEFLLTDRNVVIPKRGSIYSVNEANARKWPARTRSLVEALRAGKVGEIDSARYIGSLVADFHRTLLRGGIFCYPGDEKKPDGKIRLLYEAFPLAFVAEKAGGACSHGSGRMLDVVPQSVHQRTPIFIGSAHDVADVENLLKG